MNSTSLFISRLLIAALGMAFACAGSLAAATISAGNITTTLGPTFFIDDARNGGTDTDINQPGTSINDRFFNGLLTKNQGPTRISLTGLGFAAHTSAAANDATSVAVSFTYLGADEASGGGDDVVIGTTTGNLSFTVGGEYVFAFDTPLTANLTITGTRFRTVLTPTNVSGNGSLKLKTSTLSYQTGNGTLLSVAGIAASQITPQRMNLAKFQTVTASSVNGNRLATFATDGDAGNDSRWESHNLANGTGQINFPFPVEVGSAQVFMGVNDTLPLAQFGIQALIGGNWTTINGASAVGNTNVERNLVFSSPVTASSFRITVTDPTIRLREFALYPPNGPSGYPLGTDINLNVALQRPAVASSFVAGSFPLNAVDGRTHDGSSWQTTTTGLNTIDITFVASTKIGSVHLYSGSSVSPALADFTLKSWDGTAWVEIPGGVVTGNTAMDRVVTFTTSPTTTRVRLEFTKTGTTPSVIRELQIFPANTGNVGYALGTGINPSGSYADYKDFSDAFYQITNVAANRDVAVATGGQPALESAGITVAQTQYQVLLNLSDGTYRLRNWDTGECLSGAQLSKTPGAALTDEPYLALPHQDWILEPIGQGQYRIINAWSGLAIDTAGGATAQATALVQNTVSNATTQRWTFNYDRLAPKKGLGHSTLAPAMGAQWNYNWGPNMPSIPLGDIVFQPMQWGNFNWTYNTGSGPIWQRTSEWRKRGDGMILMGFNEPDRTDQSNIPVATAVSLWPEMMALNHPMLGPAPADDGTWLTAFTTAATSLGYRWEYTGAHAYPGPSGGSSDGLINDMQRKFNTFGLPVWLTEFSFVDWGKNQSWSEEDNYQALAEFLWRAEGLSALRKYALFIFTENDEYPQPANPWQSFSPAPRSNSYDRSGNITAFGRLYAAWDSDTTIRANKSYMVHNRALRKRMANAATTNTTPGGRTIRTDGPVVNWTLVSAGANNRYYIVSSIDGRRLSHTSGSGSPTLVAASTTGVNVEWSLTHNQHGWYYIGHPSSNLRLRLASFNTGNNVASYQMVAATTADENTQWRFIVPLPANTGPAVAPIPDQVVNELTALTFTVNATDSHEPPLPLIYSIINPPFNSSINAATGEFRWTPTETQGNGSTYTLTIRVSDGQHSNDANVNITVNEVNVGPGLATIPNQNVNEGNLLTFTAVGSDTDIPANTLTYSLINAPGGAVINPTGGNSTSGNFTWTPSEAQGPGNFTFTVRVSDGNLTANRTVTVRVNEVNTAPVLAAIATQSVAAGKLLTFTATAADTDLPANTLNFSLINGPGGAAIHPSSGNFTWTPSGSQVGTSNFTIQVSDGSLADSRSVSVNVTNPIPSNAVDDDGDGLSNLLEYALGTDPNVANASPFRIVGANPDGTVTLEFQWNPLATGVSWQIHHGSDLTTIANWPAVAPGTTTTVREGNIDRITVRPAMATPDRGFYVLKVLLD